MGFLWCLACQEYQAWYVVVWYVLARQYKNSVFCVCVCVHCVACLSGSRQMAFCFQPRHASEHRHMVPGLHIILKFPNDHQYFLGMSTHINHDQKKLKTLSNIKFASYSHYLDSKTIDDYSHIFPMQICCLHNVIRVFLHPSKVRVDPSQSSQP